MRVNVYAEEITNRIEIVTKVVGKVTYTGVRLYLELPVHVPSNDIAASGSFEYRGPFRVGDEDDSAAVTFWGGDLRKLLKMAIEKFDAHYAKMGLP